MKDTEKLQIYVTYENGSIQSWGYDGWGYETYDRMIADVQKDFPADFPATYKGIVSMVLVWGVGMPLGDELKDVPTKDIEPTYGQALIETVTTWLTELGVLTNGS